MVPAENKFQGALLYDSCYKGYLSMAAFGLHQSQVLFNPWPIT
jgi:hypothetical protein